MSDRTLDLREIKKNTLNTIANTEIEQSNIHGFGLFAKNKIYRDQVLTLLDGQVLSMTDYKRIQNGWVDSGAELLKYFFMECNYIDSERILARAFRTKYSYINHSRTPNTAISYFPIKLVTIVDILPGEELTIDYRKEKLSEAYCSRPDKKFL